MKNGKIDPVVPVLLGMAIALGVFVALFSVDFALTDLFWSVPALILAALLVFGGARKLKRK